MKVTILFYTSVYEHGQLRVGTCIW